jgi:hypothetical protein
MCFVLQSRGARSAALVVAALVLAGCGASGGNKSKVTGKVVTEGQPVTGGGLVFAPTTAEALPARGTIQPDGTFVLSTEKEGDGAVVGRHFVTYNPPPRSGQQDWDGYGTPPPQTISPFEGLVPQTTEVEVKAGENDLTIELVRGP